MLCRKRRQKDPVSNCSSLIDLAIADVTGWLVSNMTESHPVDRCVGARLREIRMRAGLSQHDLAEKLGISFQQVQKYEKGANRLSASKLWQACKALKVPIASLFKDVEDTDAFDVTGGEISPFIVSPIDERILRNFQALPPKVKRDVERLLDTLKQSYEPEQ